VHFSLVSHGRVLGRTGVELPPPAPGMRSWQFLPEPAFADARPLFAALPAAIEDSQDAIPTPGELNEIPETEREEHVRVLLRSDPRMQRFVELSEQLEAMALALVDGSGAHLDARAIGVTELELTAEAFREVLASVDGSADLSAVTAPPFYLLVAGT
jgi:hypothetical protein